MRSQCAVYVDAGYLLAASATRVTGTSLRSAVDVDHEELIRGLIAQAEEDSQLPVLRVNWYDSGSRPGGLPDFTQDQIGLLPRVKLRLGRRSLGGEQKGVDLKIGLDLASHGRQRVVDVIYLVTGDDDLTEAVEEAQSHGVQVQLLVVPTHAGRPQAVAKHLQRAADGVLLIDAETLDRVVRKRRLPDELVPGADAGQAPVADAGAGDVTDAGAVAAPAPAPSTNGVSVPVEAPANAGAGVPTPNVFAGKRSSVIVPPPQAPAIAWSSQGGGTHQEWDEADITTETIDAVARQVVEGWCTSATPESLAALRAAHPMIPGDLDRALLMDLSTRSTVYDIPDSARYALRDRFWSLVERIKLG